MESDHYYRNGNQTITSYLKSPYTQDINVTRLPHDHRELRKTGPSLNETIAKLDAAIINLQRTIDQLQGTTKSSGDHKNGYS